MLHRNWLKLQNAIESELRLSFYDYIASCHTIYAYVGRWLESILACGMPYNAHLVERYKTKALSVFYGMLMHCICCWQPKTKSNGNRNVSDSRMIYCFEPSRCSLDSHQLADRSIWSRIWCFRGQYWPNASDSILQSAIDWVNVAFNINFTLFSVFFIDVLVKVLMLF